MGCASGRTRIQDGVLVARGTPLGSISRPRVGGRIDTFEDAVECCITVDEQFSLVTPRERQVRQTLKRPALAVCGFETNQIFARLAAYSIREFGNLCVFVSAQIHIALEFTAPEDPVRRHGNIRKRIQRDGPGNGPLGRADAHDGTDRGQETRDVREPHGKREPAPSSRVLLRPLFALP